MKKLKYYQDRGTGVWFLTGPNTFLRFYSLWEQGWKEMWFLEGRLNNAK